MQWKSPQKSQKTKPTQKNNPNIQKTPAPSNKKMTNRTVPTLPSVPTALYAGSIASFLTQPFQVLKTNMIVSPSLYFLDLHAKIVRKGWTQYMRGATLAVVRQGYGFTIYTAIIEGLSRKLDDLGNFNKYFKYSIAAFLGKLTAMFFESPLTLLKTRMQVVSDSTIPKQLSYLLRNPIQQFCKGLNATLLRQATFSLVHYNTYRFLKDDLFLYNLSMQTTFWPAFLAGAIAITISQPFQVIRSQVSLDCYHGVTQSVNGIWAKTGWRGFFVGYLPRLVRKPVNSGICWSVLEAWRER